MMREFKKMLQSGNFVTYKSDEAEFPSGDIGEIASDGMTLRDYFAAKAMQSLYSLHTKQYCGDIAKYSYQMADAMIAERDGKND